jgi:Animal haem peroxidase
MNSTSFTAFTEPVALLKRSPGLFLPDEGVFSRLFPELPPHEPGGDDPSATLRELAAHIYDDGKNDNVRLNASLPAAYTFFAQFVAHDLSFDPSKFGQRTFDGVMHANLRTPRLDLDHVYGGDPDLNAHLYVCEKGNNTYRFRIGQTVDGGKKSGGEDLPRYDGRAVIPDQRDDQHVIISQLHLALMKLHNAMMDRYAPLADLKPRAKFFMAQRTTRWYYQYVIVEDLLPRMLGDAGERTLNAYRERWMGWQREMIQPPVAGSVPVEFSAGVYRVGHTTLRSRYRVNGSSGSLPLFPVPELNGGSAASLLGFGQRRRELTVSWDRLLEVPARRDLLQLGRAFGSSLSGTLRDIPGAAPLPAKDPKTGEVLPSGLAELDLERGLRLGLPSGQAVAARLGLTAGKLAMDNDPLWYYAMRESSQDGSSVGPVTAAILSKIFLDLLHLDPGSYLYQQPSWRPTELSNDKDKRKGLARLLVLAGMPFDDKSALG